MQIFIQIGESRQPWPIFQFPFFFGQVDNKESKTNIVTSQYNSTHFSIIRTEEIISTLRYECDETFSDECEFAARAEGE